MPVTDPSCIFCKIIAGEAPVSVVYEDESVLALMNIRPIHPGELMVVPKEHTDHFCDLPDDLDWEDEIRVAVEERTSLSPDALTGMEASLRFAGPETLDTKSYGRLTAWQNWIFQRPNAVGPQGALTNYGKPTQPQFDYKRT